MEKRRRMRKSRMIIFFLGLAAIFSLILHSAVDLVTADSGGFPTPTPSATATLIVLPSATPTATAIMLPTQESSSSSNPAEDKSTGEVAAEAPNVGGAGDGVSSSKSLAEVESNSAPDQEQGGSGMGSLFMTGLLIGIVILGIGALAYFLLRRVRVFP